MTFQGSLHLVHRDIIPEAILQREGNTKGKVVNTLNSVLGMERTSRTRYHIGH